MSPFSCRSLAAIVFCLAAILRPAAAAEGARAYIIADHKSGHILAQSGAQDKLQVASLTKIATAVVVLDWVRLGGHTLDQTAVVPAPALADAGDVNPIGFQAGDEVTLRDLLFAALLQSDNVAADTLASFVGRDLPGDPGVSPTARFVAQMNLLARKCKAERTRFLNPTGLDAKERPFSTALDMARITRKALDKADFNFFVAAKERRITLHRAGGRERLPSQKHQRTARHRQCRRRQDRPDRPRRIVPDGDERAPAHRLAGRHRVVQDDAAARHHRAGVTGPVPRGGGPDRPRHQPVRPMDGRRASHGRTTALSEKRRAFSFQARRECQGNL